MSKELKAPDKVTQKMTRDGAVMENLSTGEVSSISERPQEESYAAPAGAAAEKAAQRVHTKFARSSAKNAEKKALDAAQPKTHVSRLQFSEAERATPELQKAIRKSDTAADRLAKYNTLLFDKSNEIVSYLFVFFALLFTYPTYLIIFVLSLIICLSGL